MAELKFDEPESYAEQEPLNVRRIRPIKADGLETLVLSMVQKSGIHRLMYIVLSHYLQHFFEIPANWPWDFLPEIFSVKMCQVSTHQAEGFCRVPYRPSIASPDPKNDRIIQRNLFSEENEIFTSPKKEAIHSGKLT